MTRLRTVLAERRRYRAGLREERALERLAAAAPTIESAHELRAMATRRNADAPSRPAGEHPLAPGPPRPRPPLPGVEVREGRPAPGSANR